MPKPNNGSPPPYKFIPHNYRIEREQWGEELFYRDLEFENPDLINIPYYNAMRTSARERFDPSERLPRLDVASIMKFRGVNDLVVKRPIPIHNLHTPMNYMSYLISSPKPVLDRTLISHKKGEGWRVYPQGAYRYGKNTMNPDMLNLEIIDKVNGRREVRNCNRIILRYSPLIVASFTDPAGEYTISDKVNGEDFSTEVLPIMKNGEEQYPPPVPVSIRGHFRVTLNLRKLPKGRWIAIPAETDQTREYKRNNPSLTENAGTTLIEVAYRDLKTLNEQRTVTLNDVQITADTYQIPVNDLMDYLKKRKSEKQQQKDQVPEEAPDMSKAEPESVGTLGDEARQVAKSGFKDVPPPLPDRKDKPDKHKKIKVKLTREEKKDMRKELKALKREHKGKFTFRRRRD